MPLIKKLNIFRFLKLYKYKVYRIRDLPESISIGLAWGAAVSVTPLLGLHIIICFLGTFLMRGNLLAAAAGTILGNPWTFPIFFYCSYKIGSIIYFQPISNFELKISFFIDNFENLFVPTLIGSIPLSIFVWFIIYKLSKYFLSKKRNEKKKN